MHLWIICGACRHVGKTYLAQRLATALPDAWCAKLGRHPQADDKPANYFTDYDALLAELDRLRQGAVTHAIVESNRLAREVPSDLCIYIGPRADQKAEIRDDAQQLRALADITIEVEGVGPDDWRSKIQEMSTCEEEVARIFEEQQEFLAS